MKKILLLLSFFITVFASAATVDTVSIYSSSMHKSIKTVVIKPSCYKKDKKGFPVVYLLHGYSGDFSNWITRVPQLAAHADNYRLMIVCPDGGFSSWYFDSPIDSAYRYETHIAAEVVNYIDGHYKTIANKEHRAITGLSMGGHGALFIALRHPDIFGAAGSMSGGVDLEESKNRFDVAKRIGDTITHRTEWQSRSILGLVESNVATGVKIMFDCGDKDIFINGNRRLHQKMQSLKIPHDYTERPGLHNWAYWSNSIPYHLLFFKSFFDGDK